MIRPRKSIAVVCIALVVFAAWVPVIASHFSAVLVPLWIVAPPAAVAAIHLDAVRCDEDTASLLSLALSRAPPALTRA
jgi:hypothetical protein